jgi:hypothetical protein
MTTIEDVDLYAERLFQTFGTSEEVLNHLNVRLETIKQSEIDFDFEELENQFEFLNAVRRHVVNKKKFE